MFWKKKKNLQNLENQEIFFCIFFSPTANFQTVPNKTCWTSSLNLFNRQRKQPHINRRCHQVQETDKGCKCGEKRTWPDFFFFYWIFLLQALKNKNLQNNDSKGYLSELFCNAKSACHQETKERWTQRLCQAVTGHELKQSLQGGTLKTGLAILKKQCFNCSYVLN